MTDPRVVTKWSKVAATRAAIAAAEQGIAGMRLVAASLERGVLDTIELASAENALKRAAEYLGEVKT